jgi:arylsulfatase A-like enzyme
MKQRQSLPNRPVPLSTALVTGLIWGGLFGFLENLPYLLWGSLYRQELERNQYLLLHTRAILYTSVFYSLLFALVLGTTALLLWGILALIRRRVSRTGWFATFWGIALGLTSSILLLARFSDADTGGTGRQNVGTIALALFAGVLIGVILGGISYLTMRRWSRTPRGARLFRWNWLRNAVVGTFALSVLALILIAAYRALLRDSLLFRPTHRGDPATVDRPNIILISIDALRADHLGVYGYESQISPNIDRLARRGVLFRQAFSQSSWTLPSVASFITSLYPAELQVHCRIDQTVCYKQIDPMRTTIAEVMQEAGYSTYAYVSSIWIQPQDGFLQGFQESAFVRVPAPFDLPFLLERPLLQSFDSYLPLVHHTFAWGYEFLFDPRLVPNNRGDLVNQYARRFLRLHKEDRFFLWLYYMEPHSPYNPEKPLHPLPSAITPEREIYLRTLSDSLLEDETPPALNPDDLEALISLYDGNIAEIDRLVGEILIDLESYGLLNRTLIIVQADHGEEFFEHGSYSHGGTMYDETLHVPFIFSGPPITRPGLQVETPVSLLDLLPTLAEIVQVPIPTEARGHSLLPVLQGAEMEEQPIYSEDIYRFPFDRKAVRYQGYKLIYSPSLQETELYNLHNDPLEQISLTDADTTKAAELMALLRKWMEQTETAAQELPRSAPPQSAAGAGFRQLLDEGGY